MPMERKPGRYAHNVGHTDVCYSLDGSKIITCGTDGDIRIWADFDDVDPLQTCVGEWALCVRQKDKHVYIATDNNDVQIVTLSDAERDGILVRFTAPATHIAVGREHNMIAVVSEDMEIKVIDTTDAGNCYSFSGLSGPPLSVALSCDAKMVAVSSGDGYLRIWQVDTQELLKEIGDLPKVNSFMNAKTLTRMDFHPNSNLQLAYPLEREILVLDTIDWSKKYTLSCPSVNADFSIVQYSPCGKYLAAASQEGSIAVWDTTTQALVGVSDHPSGTAICAMVWNPIGNGDITFCDVQGEIGMITGCKSNGIRETPTDNVIEADFIDRDFEKEATETVVDDDDDDDENVISLEKLKRETLVAEDAESELRSIVSRSPTPRPRSPETPMQAAFMPTSTPEHLNPRYLCWNEVGVVRSYGRPDDDSGEQCSIEVDFHDTTFHSSMMMQNYQGYTMGSLSTTALVVANSSQIATIPLNSSMKEWNLTVPTGEEIVCIACSSRLVCAATSAYFVRVCSTYGIQRVVFAVPGPVVSMSAQDCNLLLAYHSAAPRNKDQSINAMLIRQEDMSLDKKEIGSALRPESTLSWLGFTDVGTPAMHDSSGILSLFPSQSNVWIPFCDTTKNASLSDGFFITAIDEKLQSLRGIRCKGSCYPGFIPRPVLSELQLQPVFAEGTTEKTQLEANLFAWSTLQVENTERKFKETALKSFALACKSSLDDRAVELLQMLRNPQLLNLCVKYAAKQNRRLADKLMEMAPLITASNDSLTGGSDISFAGTPDSAVTKQVSKRLVLNSTSKSGGKLHMRKKQISVQEVSQETSQVSENSEANTTVAETTINESHALSESVALNTQESMFAEEMPINPFVKKAKADEGYNPLNLTDKFAGFEEFQKKEKENKANATEKRKLNDSDSEKQRGKQRKLDKFMFSKNS